MAVGVDSIFLLVAQDLSHLYRKADPLPAASPHWWQQDAFGDWLEILLTGVLAGLVAWFAAWLTSRHTAKAEGLRESRRSAEKITRELAAGWSKIEDSQPTPEALKGIVRDMWAEVLVNQPILTDKELHSRTSQHINGLSRFAQLYETVAALQPKDVLYGGPSDTARSEEIEQWARGQIDERSNQYAELVDSLRAHRQGEMLPKWTRLPDASCPPIWLIDKTS